MGQELLLSLASKVELLLFVGGWNLTAARVVATRRSMRTASDSIAFEFCWRDIFVCCGLEGLLI
jgi:hypothetical protein